MSPKSFRWLLTAALLVIMALGAWGAYSSARPPAFGDAQVGGGGPTGAADGAGQPDLKDKTGPGSAAEMAGKSQPGSLAGSEEPAVGNTQVTDPGEIGLKKEQKAGLRGGDAQATQETGKYNQADADKPPGAIPKQAVTLLVTRDFGQEVLVEVEQEYRPGETALSLLQAHAAVETTYGGNFVEAINGLKSTSGGPGGRQDWFYFINGVAAGVGSGAYRLQPGDFVWWDYHAWQVSGITPAVVGCYPCPFSRGYGDKGGRALVLAAPGAEKEAAVLKESWSGLGIKVEVEKVSEKLLAGRRLPTLALGTWDALKDIEFLSGLNERRVRSGLYGHFESGKLTLLDVAGKSRRVYAAGAAIQATGQGLGDAAPLWLVIGTDGDWLKKAVAVLREEPRKLQRCYGLALTPEGTLRLPLVSGQD
ncbi:MAG: hypothetical protein PWP65_1309 [Clostridia bacterium]|nr:hypothetical protein [Clostridia bacterium]